jgi:hypothetical protein
MIEKRMNVRSDRESMNNEKLFGMEKHVKGLSRRIPVFGCSPKGNRQSVAGEYHSGFMVGSRTTSTPLRASPDRFAICETETSMYHVYA